MLSRRAGWALAVPVFVVLVGYVLWPNVETFRLGLDGELLADLFGRGRSAGTRALVNSVGVSLGTVLGGGVVGTALAWALWRYDLPFRRTLGAVAALPNAGAAPAAGVPPKLNAPAAGAAPPAGAPPKEKAIVSCVCGRERPLFARVILWCWAILSEPNPLNRPPSQFF